MGEIGNNECNSRSCDVGYDVWMGNFRGNTFSKQNVNVSTSSKKFWDFSFHEMGKRSVSILSYTTFEYLKQFNRQLFLSLGIIDLPAFINYILSQTGEVNMHYVGHSQGATSYYVMISMLPELNAKIRTMYAFCKLQLFLFPDVNLLTFNIFLVFMSASLAFVSHMISPVFRATVLVLQAGKPLVELIGHGEFAPFTPPIVQLSQAICRQKATCTAVCKNAMFLLGGFDPPQLNCSIVPEILANTPASMKIGKQNFRIYNHYAYIILHLGVSVKEIVHFGQEINSGYFRQYDYGPFGNLFKYRSLRPANYDLSKIDARKIHLYYSDNDWVAAVADVQEFNTRLGGLVHMHKIADPQWEHLDYIYGTDAKTFVYENVISIMRNN